MSVHLRSRALGFTLLELMAGILILGIVLGLGVPAFTETIRNNRASTQTNELITALTLARSEAMTRGMPVSVCAASDADQDTCAAADEDDWGFGAIVFSDRTGTAGVIDATDDIIQAFPAARDGMTLLSNSIGYIRYGASGAKTFPAVGTDVVFDVEHSGCTGNNLREITVIATGRANLTKKAC